MSALPKQPASPPRGQPGVGGGPAAEHPTVAGTSTTAQTVLKGASAWFTRVGQQVKEGAKVAGQHFDKAAVTVGNTVDQYSQQLGEAYEQRMAKETAAACEQRDEHRAQQEAACSSDRQVQLLQHSNDLVAECLTLAGDMQSELQYATPENPLGRESYGLMMLVNVMVPLFEHGLRADWKSILPAASALTSSSQWAQNLSKQARGVQPTAYAMLQAADNGWNHAEGGQLGVRALDLSAFTTDQRRLQAWLHESLNQGLLAQRLGKLLTMHVLLSDWYFPWALLRQANVLDDLMAELVKIESQPGLVNFPIGHLHGATAASDRSHTANWTQKMRDAFQQTSESAGRYGNIAMQKASEGYSKLTHTVAQAAGSPGARPGHEHDVLSIGDEHAVPDQGQGEQVRRGVEALHVTKPHGDQLLHGGGAAGEPASLQAQGDEPTGAVKDVCKPSAGDQDPF